MSALYFSYDSKMSIKRLHKRVPSAKFVAVSVLFEHQINFHKAGKNGSAKSDALKTNNDAHFVIEVVLISQNQERGNEKYFHTGARFALEIGNTFSTGLLFFLALPTYFFGVIGNNAKDTYINTAFSGGTYLHKLKASKITPPLGLKIMVGADLVIERPSEGDSSLGGGSTFNFIQLHSTSFNFIQLHSTSFNFICENNQRQPRLLE